MIFLSDDNYRGASIARSIDLAHIEAMDVGFSNVYRVLKNVLNILTSRKKNL